MSNIIRPVILCGGAGTRLWPVSRQLFPKQLLPLMGEQSLLQQTALRLTGDQFAPAIVVSGEDQRLLIKRQLQDTGAPVEAILLEPAARNTSAATTLAAAWLKSTGRDELLLLVPSDHVILDREAFVEAIAVGARHADAGAIVTFGARPTEPNTQYGYIEAETERRSTDGAFPIARFVEKPNAETAAEYFGTGRFYWNAGIFLVKASTLLDEMRHYLPSSLDAITAAVADRTSDGLFVRPDAGAFNQAQNISIDHAIMEKTVLGMVVPVDIGWSDVGSWDAVWKLADKDAAGNVTHGDVVALETQQSLLRNEGGPLIAAIGLDSIAVVAVSDAVFIAPMDRVSEVKNIVETLRADDRRTVVSPPKVAQPWGSCESIAERPLFQVKHLIVDPGQMLSLETDLRRPEHWVVVRGSAEVTVGDKVSMLHENESTYIPAGTRHRLANTGKVPLELVEIECRPR